MCALFRAARSMSRSARRPCAPPRSACGPRAARRAARTSRAGRGGSRGSGRAGAARAAVGPALDGQREDLMEDRDEPARRVELDLEAGPLRLADAVACVRAEAFVPHDVGAAGQVEHVRAPRDRERPGAARLPTAPRAAGSAGRGRHGGVGREVLDDDGEVARLGRADARTPPMPHASGIDERGPRPAASPSPAGRAAGRGGCPRASRTGGLRRGTPRRTGRRPTRGIA